MKKTKFETTCDLLGLDSSKSFYFNGVSPDSIWWDSLKMTGEIKVKFGADLKPCWIDSSKLTN